MINRQSEGLRLAYLNMTEAKVNICGMPCLTIVLSLLFPRLTLVLLWFFSGWFDRAYDGLLLPLLGLIFAPLTCIWYAIVGQFFGGEWSLVPIIGMVVAVGLDFGLLGKSAKDGRK